YDYDYFGYSDYRPGFGADSYYDDVYRVYEGDYSYYDYPNGASGNGGAGSSVNSAAVAMPSNTGGGTSVNASQRPSRSQASGTVNSSVVMVRHSK
ncbi:uncharacterized protein LOC117793198, partial [Drosophila innubila]|uniref:uncharacterized protein LOC117793198 n=1 Tax=Drosophila innubila TaxID=198719 RepID=UPI00148DA891